LGVNLLYVNDNNFWLLFHFSLPLKRIWNKYEWIERFLWRTGVSSYISVMTELTLNAWSTIFLPCQLPCLSESFMESQLLCWPHSTRTWPPYCVPTSLNSRSLGLLTFFHHLPPCCHRHTPRNPCLG
jgi:hypothetical protein